MERISRSWDMVKASMRMLNERRELVLFPVMSGLATLVVAAGFMGSGILVSRDAIDSGDDLQPGSYVLFFLGYLVLAYVTVFFQAALISQADVALRDGDPSVAGGIKAASRKAGAILGWALVSATVSMILRLIAERFGALGRLVVGLVGLAWSLVTYLVVPILVFENVSVGTALRSSSEMLKRTWGENVVGNAGVGLICFLFSLPGVGAVALGAWAGGAFGITLILLGALWLLAVAVVGSTLSGVYQTALYRYASSGSVVPAFGGTRIGEAFVPRSGGRSRR